MGHRNKTRELGDSVASQSQLRIPAASANPEIQLPNLKKPSKMSVVGVSNDISSTIIAVFTCGVMTRGSVKVTDNE